MASSSRLRTRAITFRALALLALAGVFLAGGTSIEAASTTFTVNSVDDAADGSCDAAHCSLREAIIAANANPGTDLIAFNVPGTVLHTIQPASALPAIKDPVTIDGYTQPGASPNTNATGLGVNAVLLMELDGSAAGSADGLSMMAGDSIARGLVINRFDGNGIYVRGGGGNVGGGNVIEGSFIGTDASGSVRLPNGAGSGFGTAGITIKFSSGNTIGGVAAEARNVISGNLGNGVRFEGSSSTQNRVEGNLIGTDAAGLARVQNGAAGIKIELAKQSLIGGASAGARNVISGNVGGGILIGGGFGAKSTGNQVQGNLIGPDVTGLAAIGTVSNGVEIRGGEDNTIGGTTEEARNIISGNDQCGVRLFPGATGNVVSGNFIGIDAAGLAPLGNGVGVCILHADGNTIGGTTPEARNVISGNKNSGVAIGGRVVFNDDATANVVQGNFIGTDPTGTLALGNAGDGVTIDAFASNNTIGGTVDGTGNTIAYNGAAGVFVRFPSASGPTGVRGNAIFSNAGLGIDVSPAGVTANDPGDSDDAQNFPELTLAAGGSTAISGTLESTANAEFRIEFFSNAACDPSGHGEGETFVDSTTVTTDGSGNGDFVVTFPATVAAGRFITATATDAENNTSEFSECIAVQETLFDFNGTPVVVGGLSVDLEGEQRRLPPEATGSPSASAGALAIVIAGATAAAVVLAGAAWYARRWPG